MGGHILWWRNLSETTSATCASWSPMAPTLSILPTTFVLFANAPNNAVSVTLLFKFDYFRKALCGKTRSPTRGKALSPQNFIHSLTRRPSGIRRWKNRSSNSGSQIFSWQNLTKKSNFQTCRNYKHYSKLWCWIKDKLWECSHTFTICILETTQPNKNFPYLIKKFSCLDLQAMLYYRIIYD